MLCFKESKMFNISFREKYKHANQNKGAKKII